MNAHPLSAVVALHPWVLLSALMLKCCHTQNIANRLWIVNNNAYGLLRFSASCDNVRKSLWKSLGWPWVQSRLGG